MLGNDEVWDTIKSSEVYRYVANGWGVHATDKMFDKLLADIKVNLTKTWLQGFREGFSDGMRIGENHGYIRGKHGDN